MRPVQPIQPVQPRAVGRVVAPIAPIAPLATTPIIRPNVPVTSITPNTTTTRPVAPVPLSKPAVVVRPAAPFVALTAAPLPAATLPAATPVVMGGGIMGQLARGRIGAASTPVPMQAGLTAVPQFTIVQENEETLLRSLRAIWPGTDEQISTLLAATYENGTPIINMKRRDILMEVLNMIIADGFDATLGFIRNAPNAEFILWEQSSMDEARTKLNREITIQQADEVGVKGVGKCRYCASKELIFSMKQLRSGDEPMTVFVRCVLCNKQWRE